MTGRNERPSAPPNVLLVEGIDEQYVLPWLLEVAGIEWSTKNPPAYIHQTIGVEKLLDRGALEAELGASGLQALGIVVDADHEVDTRWERVCSALTSLRPGFPQTVDRDGLIFDEAGRARIGVWIMPDNLRAGMLETLLNDARQGERALHDHAATATAQASALGAPFKPIHRDKALLHAWLAWQDPPGQPLGTAAKMRSLDGSAPALAPFVAWFRRLYQI